MPSPGKMDPPVTGSPKKRKGSDSSTLYSHLGPESTRTLLIRNLQAAAQAAVNQ
jgi:hypothetical protein